MHNMVNIQHLAKYHRGHDDSRPTPANPRDELRSIEEYKVEQIVDKQKRCGKLLYRVQWKGYDVENDTWQTARDLRNMPELLKAWRMHLWCQDLMSPSQVTRAVYQSIDQLISALLTSLSHLNMTVNPHTLAMHHVCYSCLSLAATTQEGVVSGYFTDMLTQSLLGLNKYNPLLHSGTYGPEEPGAVSTKLSLLVARDYNQIFLPFIPQNRHFLWTSGYVQVKQAVACEA
jgi:hypothetical protein